MAMQVGECMLCEAGTPIRSPFQQSSRREPTTGVRVRSTCSAAGSRRWEIIPRFPPFVWLSTSEFSIYGQLVMEASVASVMQVSVPPPPSRVSLPFTPSLELILSAPQRPNNASAPWPPRMMSLPPAPFIVLLRLSPQSTSLPAVPKRGSLLALTVLVQTGIGCQSGFMSCAGLVSTSVWPLPLEFITQLLRLVSAAPTTANLSPFGDQAGWVNATASLLETLTLLAPFGSIVQMSGRPPPPRVWPWT